MEYHLAKPFPLCLQEAGVTESISENASFGNSTEIPSDVSSTPASPPPIRVPRNLNPDTPKVYNQRLECKTETCSVPCKPPSLTGRVENGYILLTWDEPVSDGGCKIFDYEVRMYVCPESGCDEPNDLLTKVYNDCIPDSV